MQQYYIDNHLDNIIFIKEEKFHYLNNVVKVKKKETFLLFNGKEKSIYEVEEIQTKNKIIKVRKREDIKFNLSQLNINLAIGILKKDNTDLVVQKAVELGINNILLVNFKNNVVKWNGKEEKKIKRYKDIIISAVEQSKSNFIPKVKYIDNIKKIDFKTYDEVILLYEKEDNTNSFVKQLNKLDYNKKILLIVGPEGGFSQEELEYFTNQNIKFCSLGENILRAETAAIISVGLASNILSDKERQ